MLTNKTELETPLSFSVFDSQWIDAWTSGSSAAHDFSVLTGSATFSRAPEKFVNESQSRINQAREQHGEMLKFDSKMAVDKWYQFARVLERSAWALWRNDRFWKSRLLSPFAFAVMLGSLCWQADLNLRGAFNRVAVLVFCCTIPNYSSAACIPLVQSRRLLLARERSSHTYHQTLYFLGDFLVDLPFLLSTSNDRAMKTGEPLVLLQGLAFGVPLYFLTGLRLDDAGSHFFAFYFIIVSLYINGVSFATFVAHFCATGATANLLMSSFLTTNILFDGFLISLPNTPAVWSTVCQFFALSAFSVGR
jgi:ABC-type multidrug transport system permease subunit